MLIKKSYKSDGTKVGSMHREIATETSNRKTSVKTDHKFRNTLILALVLSVTWLLMFGFGIALEDKAPHRNNLQQSDFYIDALYYYYLGDQIKDMVSTSKVSLLEALISESPNRSTIGVIFLSTIISYLFHSVIQVNFFLFTIFSILIIHLRKKKILRRYSELFLISGLIPYLFLPSKECFFIMGLLIYLMRHGTAYGWVPTIAGITLMLLARPEGAVIFIVVISLVYIFQSGSLARLTVVIGSTAIYILLLREPLIEFSVLFELSAENAGTRFCNIGPFSLCVSNAGIPELVLIQRIFVNLFLPLDWIRDFVFLVANSEKFEIFEIYIRTASLFHICLLTPATFFLWRLRKTKMFSLFVFTIVYFSIYSGFLFFQSSRQIIFITTILFILTRISPEILKNISPTKNPRN